MTARYTNTDWSDVLYTSVRKAPGGVPAAARFLTERRGKSIHPNSLRAKLTRVDGESISVEMALLLTEWMAEVGGAEYADDWILALAAERSLPVDSVPPAPAGGYPNEIEAIRSKALTVGAMSGRVLSAVAGTTADNRVSQGEADTLIGEIRDLRSMLHRMERNTLRAVERRGVR